jgi:PIN domain nuclease of toxin-antitoxin system
MLNLDTHVLLYAVTDQLRPSETKLLRGEQWSISAICLWEIAKLSQLGRIEVDLDDPQVARTLASVRVWPITVEIAKASTRLDVKGDPADQLIAATSVVHNLPLVTRDRDMRRSRIVPLARSSARVEE